MNQKQTIQFISEEFAKIFSYEHDSKTLLAETYTLLSQFLPFDTMNIPIYSSDSDTIHYVAFVNNKKAILLDEHYKIPPQGQEPSEEQTDSPILIISNSKENLFTRELANYFSVKDVLSIMAFGIQTGPARYAALAFVAYGENRFKPEHINLITQLMDSMNQVVHRLVSVLEKDCLKKNIISENQELKNLIEYQKNDLVLNSQHGLKNVMDQVEQVAPLDSHVLITGETGVGKELVALAIHGTSRRANGPLISVNCGAIPESLLDSELFGFEKGAFTGADQSRMGYFEQANKGTLFLDEVGELSLHAQTKLLRALQHKIIQRVGGTQTISVNIRVIAATNRDLVQMMKQGKFRQDLWYRLNVFPIEPPPLRERKEDIPTLVHHLIKSKTHEMNLPFQPHLESAAMNQIIHYNWPGNIRELQNVIERALILSKGAPLSFPDLTSNFTNDVDNTVHFDKNRFLSMEQMMTKHINQSITLSKGKIDGPGGAAELLDMNPSTLRARMKKLGIRITRKSELWEKQP